MHYLTFELVHDERNVVATQCIMRYLSDMKGNYDEKAARALEKRFEKLLGGHGSTARLSRAIGTSQPQLHRIWAAKSGLPEWLVAIVEQLEAMPEERWPERWKR
jgi:hypothetical protein